jgi:acyl carrier protein
VTARDVVLRELAVRGFHLADATDDLDLITAGVNSASLIAILSALEDTYDVDFDTERLFSEPVTVAAVTAEIARRAGPREP